VVVGIERAIVIDRRMADAIDHKFGLRQDLRQRRVMRGFVDDEHEVFVGLE
jgi:hypothetical protein